MAQKVILSKQFRKGDLDDPDEVQEKLVEKAIIRHEHAGHEHSHDWDDWKKVDREMRAKSKKSKRANLKPSESESE
jgi:hypothetical protein